MRFTYHASKHSKTWLVTRRSTQVLMISKLGAHYFNRSDEATKSIRYWSRYLTYIEREYKNTKRECLTNVLSAFILRTLSGRTHVCSAYRSRLVQNGYKTSPIAQTDSHASVQASLSSSVMFSTERYKKPSRRRSFQLRIFNEDTTSLEDNLLSSMLSTVLSLIR